MASKRRLRQRGCEGKRIFPDEHSAFLALRRSPVPIGEYVHPYCCPFPPRGHWHLGHTRQPGVLRGRRP